jgi:hypothetical protein
MWSDQKVYETEWSRIATKANTNGAKWGKIGGEIQKKSKNPKDTTTNKSGAKINKSKKSSRGAILGHRGWRSRFTAVTSVAHKDIIMLSPL